MASLDGTRRVLRNVSWEKFERCLASKGDAGVPRVTYLDGVLELVTPSQGHEGTTSWIASLLLTYALERGLELSSFRSWTLRDQLRSAGAEPDDCFILGNPRKRTRPHLALEVQWSRRGVDKLEVYKRLDVREVWFWPRMGEATGIDIYVLRAGVWKLAKRSRSLPRLDLDLLCSFLDRPTMTAAVRAYRDALAKTA